MFKLMLYAGVGGFFGSSLRYLVGRYFHYIAPTSTLPWGTFTVNITGSLLIGVLYGLAERYNLISGQMGALLITGFCGGFTTFSSFADEIYLLLNAKEWHWFVLYVTLSLLLGILMVYLGREAVR